MTQPRPLWTDSPTPPPRYRRWPWLVAVAVVLVIAVAALAAAARPRSPAASAATKTFAPATGSVPRTATVAGSPAAATPRPAASWSARSPQRQASTTAHNRARRHHARRAGYQGGGRIYQGVLLPNSGRTPGATNPAVTPVTIYSTICVSGWTATVRPSSSYTTSLKEQQLATGYAWRGDTYTSDYEEDHLIPLELGGSPSSPANLWPEPYDYSDGGATSKDTVENKLHELVCSGALGLRTAQRAIATNWWLAARRYDSRPVTTTHSSAPQPVPTHHHSSAPAPVQHSCTTTSSGSCIRGGEFCPRGDYGQTGYDAEGTAYECTGDTSHPHWE